MSKKGPCSSRFSGFSGEFKKSKSRPNLFRAFLLCPEHSENRSVLTRKLHEATGSLVAGLASRDFSWKVAVLVERCAPDPRIIFASVSPAWTYSRTFLQAFGHMTWGFFEHRCTMIHNVLSLTCMFEKHLQMRNRLGVSRAPEVALQC